MSKFRQLQTDVLAALDAEWRSSREIAQRVGCWATSSIAECLLNLSRQGAIERMETLGLNKKPTWRFRRAST